MTPEPGPRPASVVDRYQRGWVTATDPCTTSPQLGNHRWTLAELGERRGPLRPVVSMPAADRNVLVRVLFAAGHRAVPTVMMVLYRLSRVCYQADGHDNRLVAGRPGSTGSYMLLRFAWEIGADVSTKRVDADALRVCEARIRGWIFDPHVYVEVAANLGSVLAEVTESAGGFDRVTDRWIREAALAEQLRLFVTGRA
jgi:hypothetical protein